MFYAVVGLGFIFPRHKQAIEATGGKIILTCDIDPDKKADFLDYKKMPSSPLFNDIECVVVCVPNYLHSEICRWAISQGKQVLCEKPLTIFGDFEGLDDINNVSQLRYNALVNDYKKGFKNVDVFVKTYREAKYWDSWKGQPELSGGILYNMGVHYIDLLIYMLGSPIEIKKSFYSEKVAYGEVLFERGKGSYYIELATEWCPTVRKFIVNGISRDLEGATLPLNDPNKITNLHIKVYENFIKGKGLKTKQARVALDLVEKLKNV